jgi:hypothetical protein
MNPAPVAVERNTKTATVEWLRLVSYPGSWPCRLGYLESRLRRCNSSSTAPELPEKMTLHLLNLLNPSVIRRPLDQFARLCWHWFRGLSLHRATKKLPENDPSSIYCRSNTGDLGQRELVSPGI